MLRRLIPLLAAGIVLLASSNIEASAREDIGSLTRRLRSRSPPVRRSLKASIKDDDDYRYQNNATSEFLVDSLPDIDFDFGELYAGQIPISSNDSSRNLFYIFQPTVGEPVNDITIWFNGGPGCSSLEGFLQENGAFIWSWGQYNGLPNPHSWVNLTNMLWVEYPVGTGFSQGNVTASSEEEIAQDFISFFRNFENLFGIQNYKIYITGESYAGRYVPYVASAMLDQNDTSLFDLSGILMYDPVIGKYDYVQNAVATVPYINNHLKYFNFNQTFLDLLREAHQFCGYFDYYETFMQFPPPRAQPALSKPYNTIDPKCDVWDEAHSAAFQSNPCFNSYEISCTCPILFDPLGFPTDLVYGYSEFDGPYFNRAAVKKALHVPDDITWAECAQGSVFQGTDPGQYGNYDLSADPIQNVLPRVIEATNRVLVSNGDLDFVILTAGTLLSIQNMTWNGNLGFQQKPTDDIVIDLPDLLWGPAFAANGDSGLDGPGQGVMGVQHYERGLMWAETFQSGHMQPQFQPRVAYRHLQWLLGHIDKL